MAQLSASDTILPLKHLRVVALLKMGCRRRTGSFVACTPGLRSESWVGTHGSSDLDPERYIIFNLCMKEETNNISWKEVQTERREKERSSFR